MQSLTPKELWDLPVPEFNKWRRENDLPRLFDNFRRNLPDFDEWLRLSRLTIEYIIEGNNPGEYFHGDRSKFVHDYIDEYDNYQQIQIEPRLERFARKMRTETKEDGSQKWKEYYPYFLWGSKRFGEKKFLPTSYSGKVPTFIYTSGVAPDVPESCQWSISAGGQVLKLGGVTVEEYQSINGRNLDFTNLDFLNIEGRYHGNTISRVFYSHFHNVNFDNSHWMFVHLLECNMKNWVLSNDSELYNSLIIGGNFWGLKLKNSSLRGVAFIECGVSNIDIDNSKVEEIQYKYVRKSWFAGKHELKGYTIRFYRSLRLAYAKQGDRTESRKFYYLERKNEMFLKLIKFRIYRRIYIHGGVKLFFQTLGFVLLDFFKAIYQVSIGLMDFMNYALWGFGEKPIRLIINSGVVILIYSSYYYLQGITASFVQGLYTSIFTFVRFNVSLSESLTDVQKLIIASETLFGWVFIVLLINVFANRSRS